MSDSSTGQRKLFKQLFAFIVACVLALGMVPMVPQAHADSEAGSTTCSEPTFGDTELEYGGKSTISFTYSVPDIGRVTSASVELTCAKADASDYPVGQNTLYLNQEPYTEGALLFSNKAPAGDYRVSYVKITGANGTVVFVAPAFKNKVKTVLKSKFSNADSYTYVETDKLAEETVKNKAAGEDLNPPTLGTITFRQKVVTAHETFPITIDVTDKDGVESIVGQMTCVSPDNMKETKDLFTGGGGNFDFDTKTLEATQKMADDAKDGNYYISYILVRDSKSHSTYFADPRVMDFVKAKFPKKNPATKYIEVPGMADKTVTYYKTSTERDEERAVSECELGYNCGFDKKEIGKYETVTLNFRVFDWDGVYSATAYLTQADPAKPGDFWSKPLQGLAYDLFDDTVDDKPLKEPESQVAFTPSVYHKEGTWRLAFVDVLDLKGYSTVLYDPRFQSAIDASPYYDGFDNRIPVKNMANISFKYNKSKNAKNTTVKLLEGDNSNYNQTDKSSTGADKDVLTFHFDADFESFNNAVEVDGEYVDPDNYEAVHGSTIIKLKKSYLDSLNEGSHTIKAFFKDGDVGGAKFTVDASEATKQSNAGNGGLSDSDEPLPPKPVVSSNTSTTPDKDADKDISKGKSIAGAKVELSKTTFTYNGSVQQPEVTSVTLDGKKLKPVVDCMVRIPQSKDKGTYQVVVSGMGDYSGETSVTYTIKAKKATPKVKAAAVAYTGKAVEPVLTVKVGREKLHEGDDYTVKCTNNVAVGKATAKITLKGNYKGSKKVSFKVVPPQVDKVKVASKYAGFTAQWAPAKAVSTSGYQVRYAKSKSFAKAKTVTVKSVKKTAKVVRGLKHGSKYYVQVRAMKKVGNATYYSAWSKAAVVKIK